MEEQQVRKLAVVLHADVVGSTSLVQLDETIAHRRIQDAFRRFSEQIDAYGGTAHERRGDALVAEFGRASDAVCAALRFQQLNSEWNTQLEDGIAPEIRVGIALGEEVFADNTVTGAGVVLAQRLEQLAEPGGVCLQGAVYEIVPRRFPFRFQNHGEQHVKGFDDPVRAYTVTVDEGVVIPPPEHVTRAAAISPKIANKPSIAVLPLTNMSHDPEQEYFSDGITEDIITGLSRFRELVVIARGSSFAFKGQSIDITEAARKLGATYVLEGSVRKSGNRVRVIAQLIDGGSGRHIWAETYDRELEDVFAVQDDVAQTIISTLAGRVEEDSRERALSKEAESLSAYDCLLRGRHCWPDWNPGASKEEILRAREMFEQAKFLDPDYATAYIALSETYIAEMWSSWSPSREAAGERAYEHACRAVELDDRNSHAHLTLAAAYFHVKSNFEAAEAQIRKALELNPNDYWNYCFKTSFSMCSGDFDESIWCGNEAIRRNPFLPDRCLYGMGFSEYFAKRYESAIRTFGKLSKPSAAVFGCLAACYAQLGRQEETRIAATEFRDRVSKRMTDEHDWDSNGWRAYWANLFQFKDRSQIDHLLEGLRMAGILE